MGKSAFVKGKLNLANGSKSKNAGIYFIVPGSSI
jgi:hypothetical protein